MCNQLFHLRQSSYPELRRKWVEQNLEAVAVVWLFREVLLERQLVGKLGSEQAPGKGLMWGIMGLM